MIRENLDIGRPDQVQLIFERRVTKRTPGRFRTRVLTDGVMPSLHIDYKKRASSNTTRKAAPSDRNHDQRHARLRHRQDGCITCPLCGRSAFKPTDVCWTSNGSARTASFLRRPSRK